MFAFLFVVPVIVAFVVIMTLPSRMAKLEQRVRLLESQTRRQSTPAPLPPVVPFLPPVETPPVAIPIAPPPPPPPPPVAGTALDDWETRIGGNWLNKLGVLIVVVGIALFVAYSFTQMGPAGRVGIGLSAGAVMIAAGWWLERQEKTRTFGRGLTAGGWAAIYFTAYAMHAIEAARVVEDPIAGFACLIAAAAGLVLYSLRYGSESVTGVAYFVAYAALLLAPRTTITLPASLPLAGSLLFVAWRKRWVRLALAGTAFTYLAFALATPSKELWLILACYWVMFEAFDLTLLRRDTPSLCALNGFGLVACSFLIWDRRSLASTSTWRR